MVSTGVMPTVATANSTLTACALGLRTADAIPGKIFAGGLAIDTPIGKIISTNITPSDPAGIGQYSLTDFERAVRQGIRRDGASLYPAMSYTSYAAITDSDMKALYAYFMQGVAPVDLSPQKTALPFPFNIRLSMAVWDSLYAGATPFVTDAGHSAEWNRGACLAEGLAHCPACHTPGNYLFKNDGDAGVRTTPERVKTLRDGGAVSPLLAIAKGGIIALIVVVILLVIGGGIVKSRRRQR